MHVPVKYGIPVLVSEEVLAERERELRLLRLAYAGIVGPAAEAILAAVDAR